MQSLLSAFLSDSPLLKIVQTEMFDYIKEEETEGEDMHRAHQHTFGEHLVLPSSHDRSFEQEIFPGHFAMSGEIFQFGAGEDFQHQNHYMHQSLEPPPMTPEPEPTQNYASDEELEIPGYRVMQWPVRPWDLQGTSKFLAEQLDRDLDVIEEYVEHNKRPASPVPEGRKKRRKVGDTISWEPMAPGHGLGCFELYHIKRSDTPNLLPRNNQSFMGMLNMRSLRAWKRR